jgi:intein-encoded DNA endonuclease-like protein
MRNWDKKRIIQELKKINSKVGHSPSRSEVPYYVYGAAHYHFGTFNKAKKAAKLLLYKQKYNPIKKSAYGPSKEFAYLLGAIYGDGHFRIDKEYRRTSGRITLKVRDKDFALNVKGLFEKWTGLKAKLTLDKQNFWETRLFSIDAARIFKQSNLEEIKTWKPAYQYAFVSGLFDADGGIVGKNLTKRRQAKRRLHFFNNNLLLIRIVEDIFNRTGIKYSITKRRRSGFDSKKWQYEIKVYDFKSIFLFYKRIDFSMKRKRVLLEKVIKSYVTKNESYKKR